MDNSKSLKFINELADYFNALPGVGKKTAQRYALQLIKQDEDFLEGFGKTLSELKNKISECEICHNLTDEPICSICSSSSRSNEFICVVEDIRDVLAIENTHQFNGKYHVLGGVISPMDGIGPSDLNIESLVNRIKETPEIKEVLLALRITMEGDTTNFFLYKKLKDLPVKITTIARGISFGEQIEYTDEITLAKSILNRVPYEI
ncbi:MAG: recombination protein RecR [Flavobacteriales bacterium]|nr:recombination protein RecR [Flavobacteriales bacterium]|tara:strand:- start:104 stop:718 length:615 start_codon:yes stop_codon:yes gene_type:complete